MCYNINNFRKSGDFGDFGARGNVKDFPEISGRPDILGDPDMLISRYVGISRYIGTKKSGRSGDFHIGIPLFYPFFNLL